MPLLCFCQWFQVFVSVVGSLLVYSFYEDFRWPLYVQSYEDSSTLVNFVDASRILRNG